MKAKDCPFCGGRPYIHSSYSVKYDKYFVFVKCGMCGSQGGITSDDEDPADYDWETMSVEKALTKWNTRVEED